MKQKKGIIGERINKLNRFNTEKAQHLASIAQLDKAIRRVEVELRYEEECALSLVHALAILDVEGGIWVSGLLLRQIFGLKDLSDSLFVTVGPLTPIPGHPDQAWRCWCCATAAGLTAARARLDLFDGDEGVY